MWYVGIDVHLKTSTLCILDEQGRQVKTRTIRGPWPHLVAAVGEVPRPFAVCFEASCGYGWLHDELAKLAARVVVAHPGRLRLIFQSKRKNDRIDAARLAKLLFLQEVPAAHVPRSEVREWRAMIEHRQQLLRERTAIKNVLRALLRSCCLTPPRGLWTRAGRAWLQGVEFRSAWEALRRDQALERLGALDRQVQRVNQVLNQRGREEVLVFQLQSAPGIGPRTAEAVAAYLDDPKRFVRSKAVGSYVGVVPSQDASAGVNRLGHITRQGPATVRKLLTEATWQAIRHSPRARAFYQRVQRDDPQRRKIALIATAHWLLRCLHAMLVRGELWNESA